MNTSQQELTNVKDFLEIKSHSMMASLSYWKARNQHASNYLARRKGELHQSLFEMARQTTRVASNNSILYEKNSVK